MWTTSASFRRIVRLLKRDWQTCQTTSRRRTFCLHPGELQHNPIKALGIQLDGSNLTSKVAPDRLHRVRQGLRCILHRGRCTGRVLEILVGHCTYCGLMNRCCLSIFHSVYKFIKSSLFCFSSFGGPAFALNSGPLLDSCLC